MARILRRPGLPTNIWGEDNKRSNQARTYFLTKKPDNTNYPKLSPSDIGKILGIATAAMPMVDTLVSGGTALYQWLSSDASPEEQAKGAAAAIAAGSNEENIAKAREAVAKSEIPKEEITDEEIMEGPVSDVKPRVSYSEQRQERLPIQTEAPVQTPVVEPVVAPPVETVVAPPVEDPVKPRVSFAEERQERLPKEEQQASYITLMGPAGKKSPTVAAEPSKLEKLFNLVTKDRSKLPSTIVVDKPEQLDNRSREIIQKLDEMGSKIVYTKESRPPGAPPEAAAPQPKEAIKIPEVPEAEALGYGANIKQLRSVLASLATRLESEDRNVTPKEISQVNQAIQYLDQPMPSVEEYMRMAEESAKAPSVQFPKPTTLEEVYAQLKVEANPQKQQQLLNMIAREEVPIRSLTLRELISRTAKTRALATAMRLVKAPKPQKRLTSYDYAKMRDMASRMRDRELQERRLMITEVRKLQDAVRKRSKSRQTTAISAAKGAASLDAIMSRIRKRNADIKAKLRRRGRKGKGRRRNKNEEKILFRELNDAQGDINKATPAITALEGEIRKLEEKADSLKTESANYTQKDAITALQKTNPNASKRALKRQAAAKLKKMKAEALAKSKAARARAAKAKEKLTKIRTELEKRNKEYKAIRDKLSPPEEEK